MTLRGNPEPGKLVGRWQAIRERILLRKRRKLPETSNSKGVLLSSLLILLATLVVLGALRAFVLWWLPFYVLKQLAVVASGLLLIRIGGGWMFALGASVVIAGLVMVRLQERAAWS